MKKFLKNRTAIGVGSILLALIISFGIVPVVNKSMRKQTEIVRATKDIKKGEKITRDKITKVKVGTYNLPQSIIKDPSQIIGSYATVDIQKDDCFLNTKVSKTGEGDNNFIDKDMVISVTIKNLAAGLSGKLKSGDIVSIISSEDSGVVTTIPELKYVEVLSVSTKEGIDAEDGKEDTLSATVTLSVNSIQAEKLVEHEQNGNIHFALAYRGSEEKAQEYLKIQDEYIENLKIKIKNGKEKENEEMDIEKRKNEIIDTEVKDDEEAKEGEDGSQQ